MIFVFSGQGVVRAAGVVLIVVLVLLGIHALGFLTPDGAPAQVASPSPVSRAPCGWVNPAGHPSCVRQ